MFYKGKQRFPHTYIFLKQYYFQDCDNCKQKVLFKLYLCLHYFIHPLVFVLQIFLKHRSQHTSSSKCNWLYLIPRTPKPISEYILTTKSEIPKSHAKPSHLLRVWVSRWAVQPGEPPTRRPRPLPLPGAPRPSQGRPPSWARWRRGRMRSVLLFPDPAGATPVLGLTKKKFVSCHMPKYKS